MVENNKNYKKITTNSLLELKNNGEKISWKVKKGSCPKYDVGFKATIRW